jgi:hypothetical protein
LPFNPVNFAFFARYVFIAAKLNKAVSVCKENFIKYLALSALSTTLFAFENIA